MVTAGVLRTGDYVPVNICRRCQLHRAVIIEESRLSGILPDRPVFTGGNEFGRCMLPWMDPATTSYKGY